MNDEWAQDLPPAARAILNSAAQDEPNAATLERMRVRVAALSAAAIAAEAATAGAAAGAGAAAAAAGAAAGAAGGGAAVAAGTGAAAAGTSAVAASTTTVGAVAGKGVLAVVAQSGVFKIVTLIGVIATGAVVTQRIATPASPTEQTQAHPAPGTDPLADSTRAEAPREATRSAMEPMLDQSESLTSTMSMRNATETVSPAVVLEAERSPEAHRSPARVNTPRARRRRVARESAPAVPTENESEEDTEETEETIRPLGEELALLSRIRRASPDTVVRLCRQHRANFGDARGFAAERDLYEFEALVARGDDEAAERAGTRFLRAHRGSPYAARVRRGLAESDAE